MTGKKFTYFCSVLCSILVVLSILISDVNAKSRSSHHSSSSHRSSGSHSYPSYTHSSSTHQTHSSNSRLSGNGGGSITPHKYTPTHSYPSGSSGGSGSSHHSYPSAPTHSLSGGSSGSSVHSYPSSGISLSGSGSSGSYHSNHIGTSSSVHTYPQSHPNSLSGGSSGSSVHTYPNSNTHGFGNTGNTASGTGYPHNTHHSTNTHHVSWGTKPEVHHTHTSVHTHHYHNNYVYSPPTVIHYRSSPGMGLVSYPVYTGVPPTYVYEYRSSGNRYSNLLAGLALYNLGKMSANHRAHDYHQHYTPQPNEYCKFVVEYPNGGYDEMSINCKAISYFIYEEQPQVQTRMTTNIVNQTTVSTQTMSANGTLLAPANAQMHVPVSNGVMPPQSQYLAPNGSLIINTQQYQPAANNGVVMPNMPPNMQIQVPAVPANVQTQVPVSNGVMPPQSQYLASNGSLIINTQQYQPAANNGVVMPNMPLNMQIQVPVSNGGVSQLPQVLAPNGALITNTQQYQVNNNGAVIPNVQQVNTVTTTTTEVKSVSDPKFSGKPVQLTPEMQCYVVRMTTYSNMRKAVPCELLQQYATSSLRRSSGTMVKSSLAMIMIAFSFLLF